MSLWEKIKKIISPPKPTPPSPTAGDSSSIYKGSQPAPKITPPASPPTVGSPPSGATRSGGGSSGGGSSRTPSQQMVDVTDTAQQTIQQQIQQQQSAPVQTASTSATQVRQIDSRTGKPIGTLTSAPTTKEKYKSSVEQSGYIRGSLGFLGTQIQEKIARGQTSAYKAGDSSAYYQGESFIKLGGYAPTTLYFTPVVGPTLLVGGGVEEIGTKAGRARILSGAESMEQAYGVPKAVGVTAGYGLNIASIGIGGKAFVSDINKLANLPKTSTQFIATEQRLTNIQGKPKIVTDVKFTSTQKNFFGDTRSIGVSKTSTNIIKTTDGGLQLGESVTFGATRKIAVKPLGGVAPYGKPTQFNIIAGSISKQGPIEVVRGTSQLQVTKTLEVGKTLSAGRGVAGKNIISAPLKGTRFQFGSGSISVPTGQEGMTLVKGKSFFVDAGKIQRTGTGTYQGVVLTPEKMVGGSRTIMIGGKTGSTPFTGLSQQAQQVAFQQTSAGLLPKVGTSIRVPFITTPQQIRTTSPTFQIQEPRTTQVVIQEPKQEQQFKTTQIVLPKIKTSTSTRTGSINIVGNVPRVEQTPRVTPITIPTPKIIPKTTGRLTTPTGYGTTPIPYVPVVPFIPLGFKLPRDVGNMGGLGKIKASRKYFYTPSIGALVKGTAFKVGKTSTRRFTGLEFRGAKESDAKLLKSFKLPTTKRRKKKK